eukprot:2241326-Amphidinium_carterae.1
MSCNRPSWESVRNSGERLIVPMSTLRPQAKLLAFETAHQNGEKRYERFENIRHRYASAAESVPEAREIFFVTDRLPYETPYKNPPNTPKK